MISLFAISNLGITLGYVFLAAFVVPKVRVHLLRTRLGGVGFFLLCGLHHLENVAMTLFMGHESVHMAMTSWHMIVIDVPQVVCVWMFVSGLYLEIVRFGKAEVDLGEDFAPPKQQS